MCAADVAQSSADERASSMLAAAARASLNLDENGRVRGDEAEVSFLFVTYDSILHTFNDC